MGITVSLSAFQLLTFVINPLYQHQLEFKNVYKDNRRFAIFVSWMTRDNLIVHKV